MSTNVVIRKIITISLSAGIALSAFGMGQAPKVEAASLSTANRIVSIGDNYLGVPYYFGARAGVTNVFDCSSFTQYVYKKVGISLPRTSVSQSRVGSYVSRSNLKKGDLVFFSTTRTGRGVGHVGIYVGNNRMLHTYGPGGVKFSTINSYWSSHYVTARRV
jgi:lipoprotein Spr